MAAVFAPQSAFAKPGFGEQVDAYCSSLGRGTPYASGAGQGFLSECALCHQFTYPPELPDKGNVFDPPGAEYLANRRTGAFDWFCPGAANQPPMFAAIADRSARVGEMVVIDVSASDPDGDPLVLTVSNAPAAASFADHGDGTATFTWTPGASDVGSRTVTFLAADDATPPGQALESVVLSVGSTNRPPQLGAIGNRSLDPDVMTSIAVSATDPDGDALQLTASPLPTGASFDDAGNGTGLFTWMPSTGQLGNHVLTFEATDTGAPPAGDAEVVTLTVGTVNAPPILVPIGDRAATAGAPLSIAFSASDPDGDALSFSAGVLPNGAQLLDAGDGTGTLEWLPGEGDVGVHTVEIVATDAGAPPESDGERFRVTVAPVSTPSAVHLDDARWEPHGRGGRLHVRGSGAHPRETVGILDGERPTVLGTRKASRRGSFHLVLEPTPPPCAVRAQAGETRSEAIAVRGAPADCGEPLEIRVHAKWSCEEEEDDDDLDGESARLRVKGERAPAGASVVVHDAATDAVLGAAQSDARGRFDLRIALAAPPDAIAAVVSANGDEWRIEAAVRLDSCEDGDDEDDEDEDDEDDHEEARR